MYDWLAEEGWIEDYKPLSCPECGKQDKLTHLDVDYIQINGACVECTSDKRKGRM